MTEEIQKVSERCADNVKIVLIPVTCQPPTFGMVMSIMAMYDKYDEFVICVKDDPILLDTETLIKMLSLIFRLPKFMVISHPQDFEQLIEFPRDLPFFNHVATLSDRVHTNLGLKGYGCYLIPRAIGYDENFHRSAWRQSVALDILRSNMKQTKFKDCGKKSSPRKEGD